MTESNQGPATPGTAARCEICERSFCPGASIDPGCYQLAYVRLKAENASLRAGLDFRPLGDNHHNAALCPYCSPDVEKVRAENASLREGAFEWKHEAEKRRMGYERAEQQNTSLLESLRESQKRADMNGDLSSQWHDKWAAAEQRAEAAEQDLGKQHSLTALRETQLAAAEKERDELARDFRNYKVASKAGFEGIRASLTAAEQRNTELEGALRDGLAVAEKKLNNVWGEGQPPYAEAYGYLAQAARAALHDEERSAPPALGPDRCRTAYKGYIQVDHICTLEFGHVGAHGTFPSAAAQGEEK